MKRILPLLLALGLLLVFPASCAASADNERRAPGNLYESDAFKTAETADAAATDGSPQLPADRRIIRDAELTVETKTFDDALTALDKQVAAAGGYLESVDTAGDPDDYREAELTVRIPADKLDDFLSAAEGLGSVTRKTVSARDVTEEYVDVESRIAAMTAERDALTELMRSAASLTEVLEVRDRLTQVIADLESYQARLKSLDSRIAYSTVTVTLREVELISSSEGGFWEEVGAGFVNNLARLGKALRGFAVWFLGALPWFVFFALIGLAVFLIIRGSVRRRRRRRQKAKENTAKEQSHE